MNSKKYILITAAKNEQDYIEGTITSVIKQSIKPILWIIVSDGSTDNTDEIIKSYANKYSFIKFIRTEAKKRNFTSKVHVLNMALSTIEKNNYDFIGILDADITFQEDYYEKILEEFDRDPKLGLAGGEFFDIIDGKRFRVMKSSMSVRGGIQLFRKECFNQLGKFVPLKNGGEDVIMEVSVRKNGWKAMSFDHQMLDHHRLTGTAGWGLYEAKFKEGILSYSMGYHPLFQLLKSINRLRERPYIISGILHFLGFVVANIRREKRIVSKDFIQYLRNEQIERIKTFNF
ncbi:MAG: glycosyltransferase family 2 protein [Ignavibacteriae bacterium]|nr:glycosyltransferase family 2 protein [Ignavibacteriota bacterium]